MNKMKKINMVKKISWQFFRQLVGVVASITLSVLGFITLAQAEDPIKMGIYALGGVWRGHDTDVEAAARVGSFRVLRRESQI